MAVYLFLFQTTRVRIPATADIFSVASRFLLVLLKEEAQMYREQHGLLYSKEKANLDSDVSSTQFHRKTSTNPSTMVHMTSVIGINNQPINDSGQVRRDDEGTDAIVPKGRTD
jgi:hypothetical protein